LIGGVVIVLRFRKEGARARSVSGFNLDESETGRFVGGIERRRLGVAAVPGGMLPFHEFVEAFDGLAYDKIDELAA
jgi:hypothetical protein